jgi:hypothetical protein
MNDLGGIWPGAGSGPDSVVVVSGSGWHSEELDGPAAYGWAW